MTQSDLARQEQIKLLDEANRLYEQFAKSLEEQHPGRFIAIARDRRFALGETAREVGRAAKASFDPANFVFKLGPRVTGKRR
jgi:hypothetical protein